VRCFAGDPIDAEVEAAEVEQVGQLALSRFAEADYSATPVLVNFLG